MKLCNKCKLLKNHSDFYIRKASGKYLSHCKSCIKSHYHKYKDIIKFKNYYRKPGHNTNSRKYNLKSNYNLSLEAYKTISILQNNKCAICLRDQSEFKKNFAVDHNHTTGEIRQLLCTRCNIGIGMFEENIYILSNAINYLNKHNKVFLKIN